MGKRANKTKNPAITVIDRDTPLITHSKTEMSQALI